MSRKKGKGKGRKGKKGKRGGRIGPRHMSALSRGLPLPTRTRVLLRYPRYYYLTNIGATNASAFLRPCNCYDVDAALGSTAMPGFSELSGLYRYYRTLRSTITINCTNEETFPVTFYLNPVNFVVTNNTSRYLDFLGNHVTYSFNLSEKGAMNNRRVSRTYSTETFAGGRWLGVFDNYCGDTGGTAAPNNQWYWNFGVVTPGGANTLGTGVYLFIQMEVEVEFFELSAPSS